MAIITTITLIQKGVLWWSVFLVHCVLLFWMADATPSDNKYNRDDDNDYDNNTALVIFFFIIIMTVAVKTTAMRSPTNDAPSQAKHPSL